jgi:lysophospholipid acyltransferase (LPLAT)-like uncharacterized protein
MKLRWDHPAWQRLAPDLIAKLSQAYLRTCKKELAGDREGQNLIVTGSPVLLAPWHCHLLSTLYFAPDFYAHRLPLVLMVSPSRDGEIVAAVARRLGAIVCPGSRRKGGVQALQEMAAYLRQGHSAGLIADGSRGPARVAQKGVIFLAREAQVPILPLAAACSRKLVFHTWDRFELPLPFSRIALLVGEPLRVEPRTRAPRLESWRRELEARLNHLFALSQIYFPPAKFFA